MSTAGKTTDRSRAAWADRDAQVVWHGFTDMSSFTRAAPVIVDHADGHELVDVDGNRYLDAISSLWVTTLGHRVPQLDRALQDQLARVAHSTMLGNGNRVVIELAEALAGVVPVDDPHFLFASDGASAVEQAVKLALEFWALSGRPERTRFLALAGAYHGDTVGALSLGDGGFGAEVFRPLCFPVLRAADVEEAVELVSRHGHELAAVVIEPLVQAAGGMRMIAPEAVGALASVCAAEDVLLVLDEVATGFGRTGALFAAEVCGVRPDLLCLGKGITGGYLAMSATVASGRVFDAFAGRRFAHGHSYGGNALAAAVALRHLELFDELAVLDNVAARSAQLRSLLQERLNAPFRLCGLMGGVDVAAGQGRAVCAAAVRRGVLLRPLGDTVVLMPPLTVTAAEVERIVDVLARCIADVG
ncbi:MAG: aspartate aminotransferase family protein [Acidimicrobiales bacterium]